MLRQLRLRDAVGARLLRLLVIVPEQRHARIQKLFKRSHRRARPTRLIVQLGTAGLDRFCDLRGRRGRRVALQEVKIAADAIHSEQEDERPVLDLVADLFLQVAHRVADRVDADDVFDAAKRLADPDLLTAERIDAVALIRPDLHLAPLQQEGAEHGRQHRGRAHFLRRLADEQQIFPCLIRDHDRPDVRHQPRRAERQDRLLPAVIILRCSKALRQRVGGKRLIRVAVHQHAVLVNIGVVFLRAVRIHRLHLPGDLVDQGVAHRVIRDIERVHADHVRADIRAEAALDQRIMRRQRIHPVGDLVRLERARQIQRLADLARLGFHGDALLDLRAGRRRQAADTGGEGLARKQELDAERSALGQQILQAQLVDIRVRDRLRHERKLIEDHEDHRHGRVQRLRIDLIQTLHAQPRKRALPLQHDVGQLVDQVVDQLAGLIQQDVLDVRRTVIHVLLKLQHLKVRQPELHVVGVIVAHDAGNERVQQRRLTGARRAHQKRREVFTLERQFVFLVFAVDAVGQLDRLIRALIIRRHVLRQRVHIAARGVVVADHLLAHRQVAHRVHIAIRECMLQIKPPEPVGRFLAD